MNSAVAAYQATVEALAQKVAGGRRARQVGAEYDDLVQEGLIKVWQAFERGVTPSVEMIELRMWDWVKFIGRQRLGANPTPYEALLPLDDYRNVDPVEV